MLKYLKIIITRKLEFSNNVPDLTFLRPFLFAEKRENLSFPGIFGTWKNSFWYVTIFPLVPVFFLISKQSLNQALNSFFLEIFVGANFFSNFLRISKRRLKNEPDFKLTLILNLFRFFLEICQISFSVHQPIYIIINNTTTVVVDNVDVVIVVLVIISVFI